MHVCVLIYLVGTCTLQSLYASDIIIHVCSLEEV